MAAIQGSVSSSVTKNMIVTGEARINFIITNNTAFTAIINLFSLGGASAIRIAPKNYQIAPGKTFEVKDIVFNTNFTFQLDTTQTVEYYIWTTVAQSGQSIFIPTEVNVTGGGGSDAFYEHDQVIASATWTAIHNLGKFPSVTVVTSAGDEVEGDVTYIDDNTVEINFSAPFSGVAYFN